MTVDLQSNTKNTI